MTGQELNLLIILHYFQVSWAYKKVGVELEVHPKLRNINLHNVTQSLICRNSREWMFVVQISLFIVTFLSLISQNLSSMQTTKEVNPHHVTLTLRHVSTCGVSPSYYSSSSSSATCWMLVHASAHRPGKPSGVDHTSIGDGRTNSNCPHLLCVIP